MRIDTGAQSHHLLRALIRMNKGPRRGFQKLEELLRWAANAPRDLNGVEIVLGRSDDGELVVWLDGVRSPMLSELKALTQRDA